MTPLQTELQKLSYAGLDDAAAADAINAQSVEVVGSVTQAWLLTYMGVQALLVPIEATANNAELGLSHPIRNACRACMIYLTSGLGAPFDCADPSNAAMMDALIAAGLMTAQHKADVLARATSATPLWQSLGFHRPLDHGDIKTARA